MHKGEVEADLRSLPFPDGYADVAASIHVIEHFYLWEVQQVLTEWKRVLKPGGKLILELPCMDKVLYYMTQCMAHKMPMDLQMTWLALWGDPGHKRVEMTHKWGYTKDQIMQEVISAGFERAEIEKPRYHVPPRDMRVVAYKPLTT